VWKSKIEFVKLDIPNPEPLPIGPTTATMSVSPGPHKKNQFRLDGTLATQLEAQGTGNTMSSGRPSAVLDDAQCQTVWKMASPNGATISRDQAVPYIVNFHDG